MTPFWLCQKINARILAFFGCFRPLRTRSNQTTHFIFPKKIIFSQKMLPRAWSSRYGAKILEIVGNCYKVFAKCQKIRFWCLETKIVQKVTFLGSNTFHNSSLGFTTYFINNLLTCRQNLYNLEIFTIGNAF